MEKLFIITHNFNVKEVEIVELPITKETAKMYILESNSFYITRVPKKSLPFSWGFMGLITNDKEAGIKEWNAVTEKNIKDCEAQIELLKSRIIK